MSEESTEKPRTPRPLEITAGAEPIKLGSLLLTLVEPHRGHEVAYNRWYERDHFYSGCMIGPYNFAGKRFVAPASLKKMRDPDPSKITGEKLRGSYIAAYWVLDGYHDIWNRWAVRQVKALHAAGRMFDKRDHVHTLLYRFCFAIQREEDGVPIELALDHPFSGFLPMWVDRDPKIDEAGFDAYLKDSLGKILPSSGAALVGVCRPLPLLIDAPGDVPRQEASDERSLLLWFLDTDPRRGLDDSVVAFRRDLESSGHGRVVAALPFLPTVPGTDRYTNELFE